MTYLPREYLCGSRYFSRGGRGIILFAEAFFCYTVTLLCEIHMVEFSRGRGTDLSHPLSSGLTHYILFIIRDFSKSTATLEYNSFKSPRRGFFDKINKKSGHRFFKLHKYFHYFRSHRYCNLKYSEE